MTETEWLTGTYPHSMLNFVRAKTSDRKLRLLALACCRRVRNLLTDERSQQALTLAERHADGFVTKDQLSAGCAAAKAAAQEASWTDLPYNRHAKAAVADLLEDDAMRAAINICNSYYLSDFRGKVIEFLHDVYGNPFKTMSASISLLAWHDGTIPNIARAIYDERAFDRIPILADALEDAGCNDAEIVSHCRSGGEHVRGCWVIDLLLGKQ